MAVKIELKRSAVPGKIPTVNQLDLGELAINTYDGTVYLKQDNGVQSIIQLISTASGSLMASASYAATSSLPLLGIVTASANASTITFTKGDQTTFNVTVSQSGSVATASYALFAENAATASYIPGLNLNSITTGSITASVDIDPNHLFLIKSGSTDFFNIASDSTVTSYSNLFIIKNFTTQQPVFTVSESLVLIATQSVAPTPDYGGFWFTATDFYVGLEDSGSIS
jgi:hypothetical protein